MTQFSLVRCLFWFSVTLHPYLYFKLVLTAPSFFRPQPPPHALLMIIGTEIVVETVQTMFQSTRVEYQGSWIQRVRLPIEKQIMK
jgi:hypothetical protein